MAEGIGARLRSARERSRLTILQAAERLHVDPDLLEALEAENFGALGAPVYVKGHLRHYAELVGESAESLFELYSQGDKMAPPDLTRVPKPVADDAGRLVAPAVIVVIGFAVAGAVWWSLSLSHRLWVTATSRAVPVMVATATPLGVQKPEPSAPPAGAAPSAAVSSSAAAQSTASRAAKVAAPALGQIEASFTYSADSWTEVYDATGRRLLYGMSTGPATRKLKGVAPLNVMLGDAGSVTIEVGGRAASIARFVRSDHTARFLIGADGRALAAPRKKGG